MEEFKDLMQIITYDDFLLKVKNKEITNTNDSSKSHVRMCCGLNYDEQAYDILEDFVETEICNMVELDPHVLYEKIYCIQTPKVKIIVAVFKEDVINTEIYNENFIDVKDEFTIDTLINDSEYLFKGNTEKIDPLNFQETQDALNYVGENIETISLAEMVSKLEICSIDNSEIVPSKIKNPKLVEELYSSFKRYIHSNDINDKIDERCKELDSDDRELLMTIIKLYLSITNRHDKIMENNDLLNNIKFDPFNYKWEKSQLDYIETNLSTITVKDILQNVNVELDEIDDIELMEKVYLLYKDYYYLPESTPKNQKDEIEDDFSLQRNQLSRNDLSVIDSIILLHESIDNGAELLK